MRAASTSTTPAPAPCMRWKPAESCSGPEYTPPLQVPLYTYTYVCMCVRACVFNGARCDHDTKRNGTNPDFRSARCNG